MQEGWFRSRWYEFRMGHSTYLIFLLTFTNFILISYRLLIEKVPFLENIVPDLWIFVLLFLLIYIPVSILIGYWHRRTQLKVEYMLKSKEMPLYSKMCRFLLDVQTGKASEQEAKEFRELLLKIENKKY